MVTHENRKKMWSRKGITSPATKFQLLFVAVYFEIIGVTDFYSSTDSKSMIAK